MKGRNLDRVGEESGCSVITVGLHWTCFHVCRLDGSLKFAVYRPSGLPTFCGWRVGVGPVYGEFAGTVVIRRKTGGCSIGVPLYLQSRLFGNKA